MTNRIFSATLSLAASLALLAGVSSATPVFQCPSQADPNVPPGCGPVSPIRRAWGGKIASSCFRAGTPPRLWLGEDGGRIRLSTDGGVTWTEQEVPVAVRGRVRGIYFLGDGLRGWAVTSDGYLLKTVDGGTCWTVLSHFTEASGEDAELFDVYFFGPSRGTVAGEHFLKSTGDGGAHWSDDFVAIDLCAAEVYALDLVGTSSSYLAVASLEPGPILYKTIDSGGWQVAYSPAPQSGGLCSGLIETWAVDIAPGSTPADAVVYAVSGQGNHCGAVYRGEFTAAGWCWQTEGHDCQGSTPSPSCAPFPTEDRFACPLDAAGWDHYESLYGVYALNRDTAVAVGYGGSIVSRVGGGPGCQPGEWIDLTDRQYFSTAPLITITGDDVNQAWAGGTFGDLRLIDLSALNTFVADPAPLQDICIGPATPQTPRPYVGLGPQTPWRLNGLWFSSASTGWAVGQIGRIARWNDTASTWEHVRAECAGVPSAHLNGIVFADAVRGVAVGNRIAFADMPTVYFTRTGGSCAGDWSPLHTLPPPSAGRGDLFDVEVRPNVTPPEFWAVGGGNPAGPTGGVPYALRVHRATTWTLEDVSPFGTPGTLLQGIEFFGGTKAHIAIVVGGAPGNGQVWHLDVSGSSPVWTPIALAGPEPSFQDVAVAGDQAWICSVSNGTTAVVLHNPDFHANPGAFSHVISAEAAAGNVNLNVIDAVPSGGVVEVMIGGTQGALVHSLDGVNFSALDSETHKPIRGLSYPVAGRAWIMGSPAEFDDPDSITLRY